eukprot:scaffold330019_cov31-Prasinocladus_malaysianus.AAC.1
MVGPTIKNNTVYFASRQFSPMFLINALWSGCKAAFARLQAVRSELGKRGCLLSPGATHPEG